MNPAPFASPPQIIAKRWRFSLALGLGVTAAAGSLLLVLWRQVEGIRSGAGEIWDTGQLIANNTVHVPHLELTNRQLDQISNALGDLADATARIERAVTGRKEG